MRVLVVEDERDLNRAHPEGAEKGRIYGGRLLRWEEAQLHFLGAEYDAVLLDVMMPRKDGYTLVQEMREQGIDTPVLFLTARDSVSDRVKGLDLGADDYLIKPFDFDELLARIRAMTRKHAGQRTNCFTAGDLARGCRSGAAVTRGGGRGPTAAQGVLPSWSTCSATRAR